MMPRAAADAGLHETGIIRGIAPLEPAWVGEVRTALSDVPPAGGNFPALAEAVSHVCRKGYLGDASARPFDPRQPGPHRMIFIAEDGSAHPLNNFIPDEWRPSGPEEIELVACTSEVALELFENCVVGYREVGQRFQPLLPVRVVSVHSGVWDSMPVVGYGPRGACHSLPIEEPTYSDDDLPHAEFIAGWVLERLVPAPGCGGAFFPVPACYQCWVSAEPGGPEPCLVGRLPRSAGEQLAVLRPGQQVALEWQWERAPKRLFASSYEIRWRASPDPTLLTKTEGPAITAAPTARGDHVIVAEAVAPDAMGIAEVIERREYRLPCREAPVVEPLVLPDSVRVGNALAIPFRVMDRLERGWPGESFSWTWLQRPSGSSAMLPQAVSQAKSSWQFIPDVVGTYELQLDYNDGAGPGEPLTGMVTAKDRPEVSLSLQRTATVEVPFFVSAVATLTRGAPRFTWRLASKPPQSQLGTSAPSRGLQDRGNSFVVTPDSPGTYVVEVILYDSSATSEPAQIRVDVAPGA